MTPLLQAVPIAAPVAGWAAHALFLARRLRTARTDPLTGLMSRAAFTSRANRAVKHPHAAVLLLDLDGFKDINDTYGHFAGDQVLAAVGHRLDVWCADRHGFAGRLGGDEFAAVIRLAPDTDPQIELTYGLWPKLSDAIDTGTVTIHPSGSIGICRRSHRPGARLPELLRGADEAMYRAKRLGHRWQPAMSCDVYATVNGRRIGRPGTGVRRRPARGGHDR
ncbi:GGDEF domain-containing protein [Streptomyces mashuensis]|uniref:GGDEF domain-containing protein n=1 Tax=Streptomyces mashuensis TaxID=33904 RepID=A0A919B3G5_9ACTN|nr:GGDEF domain-containing protein [Streptomyces mashuensis]GHF42510.1 GGDEF domain-containing protein [Streptomyces mashuensis]